jgi:hypothetical protein
MIWSFFEDIIKEKWASFFLRKETLSIFSWIFILLLKPHFVRKMLLRSRIQVSLFVDFNSLDCSPASLNYAKKQDFAVNMHYVQQF